MKTWQKVAIGTGIGAAVLCGGGAVACGALLTGGAAVIEQEQKEKAAEVELLSCERTVINTVEARFRVVNNSDRTRSYAIKVEVKSGDTRVGEAIGFVNDLAPGQKAEDKAVGTLSNDSGKITCVLTDVS